MSAPAPIDRPRTRWAMRLLGWLALAALALLFTTANWFSSLKVGPLSMTPAYDDVVYLNKASIAHHLAREQGPLAMVRYLGTEYLHAPFPVLLALGGFAVLGPDLARVYFALALVVFTWLALVAWLARALPPGLRAAVVLGSLTLPFVATAAQQFRPDPMWTIVLSAAGVFFLAAERPFAGRRPAVLYGLALGLALLTKPSTFAMTFLVMGGCWLLAAGAALVTRRADARALGVSLAWTAAVAVLVCGWYVGPNARPIFDYFYQNSFGENRDVWGYKFGLWKQWTYYFQGPALASNLGGLVFPLLFAYLVGAGRDLWRGETLFVRIRGGAFLWMLGGLILVNSAFGMKSPYLGGSLYGFLMFGALWQITRFLGWGITAGWWASRPRQIVAALGFCAVMLGGMSYPEVCVVNRFTAAPVTAINRGVFRDLARNAQAGQTLLAVQSGPVVHEYLAMALRAKKRPIEIRSGAFFSDLDRLKRVARKTDFVLLQDPGTLGRPGAEMPSEALLPSALTFFQGSPDWQLVNQYPDQRGKFVYLYRNLSPAR